MAEILAVVPKDGVEQTDRISYMYLINAEVSSDKLHLPYGFLWRHAKSENYMNPFKAVRGEEGGFGDDGIPRWAFHLWKSGQEILGGGVDEPGLRELLENAPDCAVLVPPKDIAPIEVACEGLGHTLEVIKYEGVLTTS